MKAAAVIITAAFFLYLKLKLRRMASTVGAVMMAAAFLLGYGRGAFVSRQFHTPEAEALFSRYEATNPGQFNYAMYLKGLGVCNETSYKEMWDEKESQEKASVFPDPSSARGYFSKLLEQNLSQHDADMYKAILLGQKSDLDPEVRKLYQSAGISHLLAVSGLHVGMLGMGLYGALRKRKLSRMAAGIIAGGLMIFYAMVTGASGSTVRAVIMLVVSFAAAAVFRTYDMLTGLSLALILILLWRPYQLIQSGFQLSFGAVAAIAIFCRTVIAGTERLRLKAAMPGTLKKRIPKPFRLPQWGSVLIVGAGIQLFTLPMILWHYFVFPPYAVLLNLIVIPLMSAALASGVAVVGLGTIMEGAGVILRCGQLHMFTALPVRTEVPGGFLRIFFRAAAAAPGHYILKLYESLANRIMQLPFASVCTGRPALGQILVYYMVLACMTAVFYYAGRFIPLLKCGNGESATGNRAHSTRRALIYGPLGLLAAGLIMNSIFLRHIRPDGLVVTAIDVGQGDGFLVETPEGCFMIDGGSSSNARLGENVLEPLLLAKGITELEFAVISHGDSDHTSGIEYLLSGASAVRIKKLVLPAPARDNEAYDVLRTLMINAGEASVVYLRDGAMVSRGESFTLRCIYAGNTDVPEEINRNSSALLLEDGIFRMLFTGDMVKEDEPGLIVSYRKLYAETPLTVLKVAHHGSATSTSGELLETIRPRYAVISAGRRNRYGHPSEEVTERLQDHGTSLLETAKAGAVELRVETDKLKIRTCL